MYKLDNLENTKLEEILDSFNLSFSDYMVPFQLTLQQLKFKMVAEDIDLAYSIGAFEENNLIGFILHGKRSLDHSFQLYNGGTGVIPEKRGNKLTQKMYDFALSNFKSKSISSIVLEVISENVPAIKSYEKVGFKFVRKLNCFKGDLKELKQHKKVIVKEIDHSSWEIFHELGEVKNTWQNSKESLRKSKNNVFILGAILDKEVVAYLALSKSNNRLRQIAVSPEFRRQYIGSTLLNHLSTNHSGTTSFINVDAHAPDLNAFLQKVGLVNFLQQDEMILKLA